MKAISLNCKWQTVVGLCCWIACLCSCDGQLTLQEAFNRVSEIDCFEMKEYESDRYGFPENFGKAKVCIHPNSSCREKVIDVLSCLPEKWLAFETSADGQLNRFYVTPDASNGNLLFVHIGQDTGDTMLILFHAVSQSESKKLIAILKENTGCE